MKKVLSRLFTAVLAGCMLFGCVACGGGEENRSLFSIATDPTKTPTFLNTAETVEYLTNVKTTNPNPTALSLEEGVRARLNTSFNRGALTINNFEMYLQEKEGVLITQGSFTTTAGNAKAESKFYHDGTYLGIETTENGQVDKQKEELPIANIGMLIGETDLIEQVKTAVATPPDIDELIAWCQRVSVLTEIFTVTNADCFIPNFVRLTMNGEESILLDTSYNFIGYRIPDPYVLQGSLYLEKTNKVITMPSDFASWSVRPQA